jgi:hypothetical protein
MDGADGPLDMTRRIARAAAVTDPTPVSALIAAFAYPVYSPPPAPRRTGWDSRATVFGVDDAGHLKYFRLEGARVVARGDLGGGFGGMKFLTAGDDGELYAVLANGMLHYYKLDSRLRWVVQGRMIGSGFGRFTSFFAGGTRRGGERVLYGVQDGELMAFRFTAGEKPDELEAKKIGWSWGPGNFPVVLGGPGGVVYAVRSGFSPALLRFRFDGSAAPSPETAGRGWGGLPQVFGGPRGAVFAVDRDGRLLLYRDPGRGRPLAGPETVGEGFGLRHLTAMKSW